MEMEEVQQTTPPPPTEEETKAVPVVLEINDEGTIEFSNQMELANSARLVMRMNLCPPQLKKEGLEAVMSAMILCKQLRLPASCMNEMAYVKGKLTVYGSLVTALAERHPEYGEKEEFFVDDEGKRISFENGNLKKKLKPFAAVMRIRKKGGTVWNEYSFTMEEAVQAGITGNPTWKTYPADMLMHKAKNRAYKGNFASALNGINYHEDIVEAIDRGNTREVNPAEQLNNL